MKLKHYIIGIVIVIIDQLSKFLVIDKNISIVPNFYRKAIKVYVIYLKSI